ncbi:hypothetical protein D1871_10050 [Nakamurella silvestris]|nr:hypothetical protein D1871_10050 [Nakamurella silvestris]
MTAPNPMQARDDEDTAVVIAVIAALADQAPAVKPAAPRAFWGNPAHQLGISRPGLHGWWIAGQPR